jgi:hypothetical protein
MTSLAKHIFASPQCSSAERISNQPSDLVGTATSNNSRIQSIVTQEIAPSSVNRHEPSLTYNISHAEVINTRLTPLSSANNPLNTNGALPLNENEIHDNNEQQLDQDHDDNENDDYILPLNEVLNLKMKNNIYNGMMLETIMIMILIEILTIPMRNLMNCLSTVMISSRIMEIKNSSKTKNR